MQAYCVKPDGFGYIALLPESNAFFWNKNTAGKFCEAQTKEYIQIELRKYVDKADFQQGFYKTIRKFNALEHLKQYVLSLPAQSLLELANEVLALEPELRAIIPSIKHPCHKISRSQVNDLIWLCIRIRRQFKTRSDEISKSGELPTKLQSK